MMTFRVPTLTDACCFARHTTRARKDVRQHLVGVVRSTRMQRTIRVLTYHYFLYPKLKFRVKR